MADRWQQVVVKYRVHGKQAHDARIVTVMIEHGIRHILTLNPSDFERCKSIIPVTPTEVFQ